MKGIQIFSMFVIIGISISSCFFEHKPMQQSIIYDTTITELTEYFDSIKTHKDDSVSIIFNYNFNNRLAIKLNGSIIIQSTLTTDYSLGYSGSYFIPKSENEQRLEIFLGNIRIGDFIVDKNYRNIHVYRLSDSTLIEYTNNIRTYE